MKKRLVGYISLIVTVALLLMFGLGLLVTMSNNNEITSENLIQTTRICADIYNGDNESIKQIDGNIRITIVASNGVVLADTAESDLSAMENHLAREEIQSALSGAPKVVSRYSQTLGSEMLYYAEKVDLGDDYVFIRTSTPTRSVSAYLVKTIPLTLLILFGLLSLSTLFSILICDKLIKPYTEVIDSLQAVNSGKYTKKIAADNYQEINEAVSGINDLAEKISKSIDEANTEKNKLDYIINNINDGIVAVDGNNDICMVNAKASEIFGATLDLMGKTVASLISDETLLSAISVCAEKGTNSVFELAVNKSVYLVTVKRLTGGWKQSRNVVVSILSDITQAKNNEKLRSEFFANASHELKTPLTAIKGFNEIIGLSNKDEKLSKPIEQIAKEADKMLTLIDDMLKLSKLETTDKTEKTAVSLLSVTEEVTDSLALAIKEKGIELQIEGNATVQASKEHIYELIKNLTENSVRYNVEGGKIAITLSETANSSVFEIKDTGIGIDSAHQTRIFERFYRVEKSRSRLSGGTGLGLSIVKHICLLYNAEISLKSNLGVGTTVTVNFKK